MSDVIHIVGLAPNPWQGQWVNRQQLLSRLGLKHRVLYSTGARSLWDRDSPEWRGAPWLGSLTPMDNVGVETAPKTMLRWPSWPRYDAWIQAMHARRLRQLSGPGTKSTVAMIFHPAFLTYARCLGANLVAYHAYDLFEATPGWTPELDSMEVELLRRADIVSTVSPGIQDRLLNKGAREVRLLPNGVDLTSFSRTRSDMGQPEDLATIPHPRLGYVGSLHPQVDYGLVARLAQSRPSWHLVLVGGMPSLKDLEAEAQLSVCRSLPNVHFLGEKSRHDVPAYLHHMDVNLMLYRHSTNSWVDAAYPLKLHEYLAVGKPVVSADIPAVREFRQVIQIAEGLPDWLRAIEDALDRGGVGTPGERLTIASANTWDSRVRRLEEWLMQGLAERLAQEKR